MNRNALEIKYLYEILVSRKGLMRLCKLKDLYCPTVLNLDFDYSREFVPLSNQKCHTFSPTSD